MCNSAASTTYKSLMIFVDFVYWLYQIKNLDVQLEIRKTRKKVFINFFVRRPRDGGEPVTCQAQLE